MLLCNKQHTLLYEQRMKSKNNLYMINMSQSLLCCSAGFPSGCDILRIKGCLLFPKINSLFHFGLKVCQLLGVCVMFSFFCFFWGKTDVVLMCSCSAAERIPLSSPSVGKKDCVFTLDSSWFVCVPVEGCGHTVCIIVSISLSCGLLMVTRYSATTSSAHLSVLEWGKFSLPSPPNYKL